MAKIGLVTVLYKSDDVLPDFFKSISIQTFKNYILYLIDNSASDTTDEMIAQCLVKSKITEYKHIKSGGNVGVAAGNNIGIRLAFADGCSHVLLLNNDIDAEQDFVFSKLLSLTEEPGESMVVPKIYYYGGIKIWMAGGYMSKWRALGVHDGYNKEDGPAYNVPRHISYAPTCFMLIKKEVFDTVGQMDEKYFAYYDDTDFVFRAIQSGYKIYYEPSVHIWHKVSSSAGADSTFYVYYSNRNKLYFIRKNLKSIPRLFSIFYVLASRVAFWLKYEKTKRRKLVQGLKDGFRLKVGNS
ncbi:MAG: glycosyltransferase family 2 protein [Chitinophagaceae bacterium]|nr:glycosyltransferase family 2 protein [Chitinophagaceae bacterium]